MVPGLGRKLGTVILFGLVNIASLACRAACIAGERTLGNPVRGLKKYELKSGTIYWANVFNGIA